MTRTIEVASKTVGDVEDSHPLRAAEQPPEAVRQRREAEQAPARSVVVRYLHRVTWTMPLKQSGSAGKGLERLCRARSVSEPGKRTTTTNASRWRCRGERRRR